MLLQMMFRKPVNWTLIFITQDLWLVIYSFCYIPETGFYSQQNKTEQKLNVIKNFMWLSSKLVAVIKSFLVTFKYRYEYSEH